MRTSNTSGWNFFFALALVLTALGGFAWVHGNALSIGDLGQWLGALAGVGAVFVALHVAGRQVKIEREREHARDLIYLKAVIAAGDHADTILGATQDFIEDDKPQTVEELLSFTRPAELERAEMSLRSFPLHSAPTAKCIESILGMTAALSEVRAAMVESARKPQQTCRLDFAAHYNLLCEALDDARAELKELEGLR